jgi:hypothetical protein
VPGCCVWSTASHDFDAANKARLLAQSLARQVPGVAVLERTLDPETGDGTD